MFTLMFPVLLTLLIIPASLAASKAKKSSTATTGAARDETVKLWPDAKHIVYELDLRMPEVYQTVVRIAFEEVENKTCLRFVERPATEDDETDSESSIGGKNSVIMVRFSRQRQCSSSLGYKALPYQFISLHPICFASLGNILRQIMLTLGIDNEHNRPDRDQYVTINYKNIPKKWRTNFHKVKSNPAFELGLPYDYDSLMQYSAYAYGYNKTIPTIIPTKPLPKKVVLGQRITFSNLDLKKINLLYCNKDESVEE